MTATSEAPTEDQADIQTWAQSRPIYLDYNATSPVAPRVITAMMPYLAREMERVQWPRLWPRGAPCWTRQ